MQIIKNIVKSQTPPADTKNNLWLRDSRLMVYDGNHWVNVGDQTTYNYTEYMPEFKGDLDDAWGDKYNGKKFYFKPENVTNLPNTFLGSLGILSVEKAGSAGSYLKIINNKTPWTSVYYRTLGISTTGNKSVGQWLVVRGDITNLGNNYKIPFNRTNKSGGTIINNFGTLLIKLSGKAGTTTYEVVDKNSDSYFRMLTCPELWFVKGRYIIKQDYKEYASIISLDKEKHTITLDKTLNPDEDWNLYPLCMSVYCDCGINIGVGGVANYGGIAGVIGIAGYYASALGMVTSALGQGSFTTGYKTIAYNLYETALGLLNKSHTGPTTDKATVFSVGIGDNSKVQESLDLALKNAIEIMQNGDAYIYGIGGYDGNNISNAQTLQQVLETSTAQTASESTANISAEDMKILMGIVDKIKQGYSIQWVKNDTETA